MKSNSYFKNRVWDKQNPDSQPQACGFLFREFTVDVALSACLRQPYVGPAEAERVVAAVENVVPTAKRRLHWTYATLQRARKLRPPVHTVPMPLLVAVAYAWQLALLGRPRVGGLLLLQWVFGLRPGEAVGLEGGDTVPASLAIAGTADRVPTLLLKPRTATKSGRPQVAMPIKAHVQMADALCAGFHATTPSRSRWTNLADTAEFGRALDAARRLLPLRSRYTPHGPRSGWATALRVSGVPFGEIQELGRWENAKSVRIYLDISAVLSGQVSEPGIVPLASWVLGLF